MDFDFDELLREAGSNTSHAKQRINQIDDVSRKDKQKSMKSLAQQRKVHKEEMRRRAPAPPEPPKFVIPKKKKEEDSKALNANVQAFLRRKEEAKLQKMRQEKEDREELIKHRMKESGGRASKKIAKHFGLDALQMQKKYGHDRDHEVVLERNAIREKEELETLADGLRGGVYRALAKNKVALDKCAEVRAERKEPFRVGTRKSNSILGLNSRSVKGESYKEPAPYTPGSKVGDKRKSAPGSSSAPLKKRPPPSSLDFDDLMRQASDNKGVDAAAIIKKQKMDKLAAQKQEVRDLFEGPPRPKAIAPPMEKSKPSSSLMSKSRMPPPSSRMPPPSSRIAPPSSRMPPPSSRMPPPSSSSSQRRPEPPSAARPSKSAPITSSRSMGSSRPDSVRQKPLPPKVEKKAPPPEPDRQMSNVLVPGKRYLPGDARYQAAVDAGLIKPVSKGSANGRPSSSVSRPPARPDRPIGMGRPTPSSMGSSRPAPSSQIRKPGSSSRDLPSARPRSPVRHVRDYDKPRSHQVDRRRDYDDRRGGHCDRRREYDDYDRPRNSFIGNSDDEFGDDYDEEYDSEMDDFIDDTEIEDFQHRELEDTLKLINRNYDKKKWRYNEMTIDERGMQASYRDISREEQYSAKVGMYEDIREAQRGSTAI